MQFSHIAIIGRHQDPGLDSAIRALCSFLLEKGRTVVIEQDTAVNTGLREYPHATIQEIGQQADLAIVMGGDGTMLSAARNLAPYSTPLVGINHGRLGFITDIPVNNAADALASLIEGRFTIEDRSMLQGEVWRKGKLLTQGVALNDVVINRSGRQGMIEVTAMLDDRLMGRMRADGFIVSTPTGSTAYALAANGPVIHPSVSAFLLVPVAPQSLSNRATVFADSSQLRLTLTESDPGLSAHVHFDMQTWSDLQQGDEILVRKAPYVARFVHPEGDNFFKTLRQKINWNSMPV